MKKLLSVLMTLLFLCSLCLLTACGEPTDPTPCTEHTDTNGDLSCDACGAALEPSCAMHKDENADKLCDSCGTEFFPRCVTHTDVNGNALCDVCGADLPLNVRFSLSDQEGNVIAGVTVVITDDELEEYSFITDEDGCGELMLYSGTYRVTYDTLTEGTYFPEGYLPIPSTVTVSKELSDIEIEILKTVPNGEADRPFPIDEGTNELTLPASTVYHYIIYHSSGRNVVFEGSGFKLTYGDKDYTPDGGRIAFTLSEVEANENSHLIIENTTDSEITVDFLIYSDPGSFGNPFEIPFDTTVINADVSSGAVYYKYVVGADGTVTVKTTQMLIFKSAVMSEAKPLVKISGDDNTFLGVWKLDDGAVSYTLTITEDSIVIEDGNESSASISGTYAYTLNEDGEFALKDGNDLLPVVLFKGGNIISATCSSNSKQVVINGAVEMAVLEVKAGDEIKILVNCEYKDELKFEIYFTADADE